MGLKMLLDVVVKVYLCGDIYWYDFDYLLVMFEMNCCLIDFDGMFKNGYKIGNVEVVLFWLI